MCVRPRFPRCPCPHVAALSHLLLSFYGPCSGSRHQSMLLTVYVSPTNRAHRPWSLRRRRFVPHPTPPIPSQHSPSNVEPWPRSDPNAPHVRDIRAQALGGHPSRLCPARTCAISSLLPLLPRLPRLLFFDFVVRAPTLVCVRVPGTACPDSVLTNADNTPS